MYLRYFGLTTVPFGISPHLDFLYRSASFEESMAHLAYGLGQGEAIIMITGPIGSGKTTALQSFLANLGSGYRSALVTNTQVSTVELLKLILEDLDYRVDPGWDKSDALIAFKRCLIDARKEGEKVVVVVDEAQNLSSDVLEEVRLLTNLGQGAEQPVQLVLVGQPELEKLVDSPRLAQLRQRIRVHYKVAALSFEEMAAYVKHRLAVAGCSRPVFEEEALRELYRLSGGIPRLVNTHAGDALLSAYVAQRPTVSARDVAEGVRGGEGERAAGDEQYRAMPEPARNPAPSRRSRPAGDRQEFGGYVHRRSRAAGLLVAAALLITIATVLWFFVYRTTAATTEPEAGLSSPTASPMREDRPVEQVFDADRVRGPAETSPETVGGAAVPASPQTVATFAEPDADSTAAPSAGEEGSPRPAGIYYLHVASFRDPVRAEHYVAQLHDLGLSGLMAKTEVRGAEWHRIYVGPAGTRAAAEEMAGRLVESKTIQYFRVVDKLPVSPGDAVNP